MDTFKTGVRGKEGSLGVDCMGVDFRLLTVEAGMGSLSDVSVDLRP